MTVLSTYPTYHPTTPPTVWLTSGNALTGVGNEFLGTTNNQPLIFRTSNTTRMVITQDGKIGIGTTSPNSSAILEILSNSSGILIPRLSTTQRNSISSPTTGLLIYNINTNLFEYYDGNNWQSLTTSAFTETDPEVNVTSQNAVPRWYGSALVDGSITDNGTNVSIGSNFTVEVSSGNTTTNGNLTVNGNTTLGDGIGTDNVVFNATVASNVVPDGNATRNLGNASTVWNTVYANGIRSASDGYRLIYYPTIQKAFFDIVDPATNNPLVTIGPLTNTSTLENGGVAVKERTNGNIRAGIGWNGSAWAAGVGNQDNSSTPYGIQFLFDPANNSNDPRLVVLNGSTTPVFAVDKEGDVLTNTFRSTGSVHYPVTSVNATTNLDATHFLVLVNASSGAVTVNLPQASTCTGRMYVIMKIDNIGNSVTIDPDGSETINGFTTISITSQWGKYVIMSTGSSWVAW